MRREACPPARRPRHELRSARRLEARPGPTGLAPPSSRAASTARLRRHPPAPQPPSSRAARTTWCCRHPPAPQPDHRYRSHTSLSGKSPHRIRTTPSGLDNSRTNKPSTTCAQPQDLTEARQRGDIETNNTTARPNKGPVKPASPLHPENALKTPISHPQRRWRFQPHTDTREQRRQGFQTTGPPRLQGPAAPPTLTKPGHARVVPCLHGCQTTHRVPLRQRRP